MGESTSTTPTWSRIEALRHPPNSLNPPHEILEVSLHHAPELPVCREASQAAGQIEFHVVTNATPRALPLRINPPVSGELRERPFSLSEIEERALLHDVEHYSKREAEQRHLHSSRLFYETIVAVVGEDLALIQGPEMCGHLIEGSKDAPHVIRGCGYRDLGQHPFAFTPDR